MALGRFLWDGRPDMSLFETAPVPIQVDHLYILKTEIKAVKPFKADGKCIPGFPATFIYEPVTLFSLNGTWADVIKINKSGMAWIPDNTDKRTVKRSALIATLNDWYTRYTLHDKGMQIIGVCREDDMTLAPESARFGGVMAPAPAVSGR